MYEVESHQRRIQTRRWALGDQKLCLDGSKTSNYQYIAYMMLKNHFEARRAASAPQENLSLAILEYGSRIVPSVRLLILVISSDPLQRIDTSGHYQRLFNHRLIRDSLVSLILPSMKEEPNSDEDHLCHKSRTQNLEVQDHLQPIINIKRERSPSTSTETDEQPQKIKRYPLPVANDPCKLHLQKHSIDN